jgi:hypothetical protein
MCKGIVAGSTQCIQGTNEAMWLEHRDSEIGSMGSGGWPWPSLPYAHFLLCINGMKQYPAGGMSEHTDVRMRAAGTGCFIIIVFLSFSPGRACGGDLQAGLSVYFSQFTLDLWAQCYGGLGSHRN